MDFPSFGPTPTMAAMPLEVVEEKLLESDIFVTAKFSELRADRE